MQSEEGYCRLYVPGGQPTAPQSRSILPTSPCDPRSVQTGGVPWPEAAGLEAVVVL